MPQQGESANLSKHVGGGGRRCKMAVQEDPEFTSFHRHTESTDTHRTVSSRNLAEQLHHISKQPKSYIKEGRIG